MSNLRECFPYNWKRAAPFETALLITLCLPGQCNKINCLFIKAAVLKRINLQSRSVKHLNVFCHLRLGGCPAPGAQESDCQVFKKRMSMFDDADWRRIEQRGNFGSVKRVGEGVGAEHYERKKKGFGFSWRARNEAYFPFQRKSWQLFRSSFFGKTISYSLKLKHRHEWLMA